MFDVHGFWLSVLGKEMELVVSIVVVEIWFAVLLLDVDVPRGHKFRAIQMYSSTKTVNRGGSLVNVFD